MTTHQHHHTLSHSHSQSSARSRKSSKSGKDANKRNVLSANFNSQSFEIPAVNTNGMKNIEHFIDKSFVEGKQWYRCKWQHCSYSTIRSDSIVRHMRKHTGERPYKCWFCSYATIQSSALKIHMRRHTGERPYVCKYDNCGKRFAVLNTLVVHERTHTGYKPYKCSYGNSCNYSSSDRCKLVTHMRKTHHVELDSSKILSLNPPSSGQPMNTSAFPMNGNLSSSVHGTVNNNNSISNNNHNSSLALFSGAMSPSHLFSSSLGGYNPFAVQSSSQMMSGVNSAGATVTSHAKPDTSSFLPLNFLSVLNPSNENVQTSHSSHSGGHSHSSGRSKQRKSTSQSKVCNQSKLYQSGIDNQTLSAVKREENSIKRVMLLVDKRIVNTRATYYCKWPNCNYDTSRSDSIVRHIRQHTGERPYKCSYENCNYATIQRSTLNKHMSRHWEYYSG